MNVFGMSSLGDAQRPAQALRSIAPWPAVAGQRCAAPLRRPAAAVSLAADWPQNAPRLAHDEPRQTQPASSAASATPLPIETAWRALGAVASPWHGERAQAGALSFAERSWAQRLN
jgi:hypothetical protein